MRLVLTLASVALAALLVGCGATTRSTPVPAAGGGDQVALALEAYSGAVAAAGDGAALRQALDQVELALALAPDERQRTELAAAEADLVAKLGLLDAGDPVVTPTVVPTVELEATPAPTALSRTPVRPVTTPTVRPGRQAYALTTRKSFEGSGNSGQFASCIDVKIVGRNGPVNGAVIGINNGDHSYQNQTDQNGYAGRCGLGASTWSVVLFWTPNGGQARGAATTVYVSGAPEQRAATVFQER